MARRDHVWSNGQRDRSICRRCGTDYYQPTWQSLVVTLWCRFRFIPRKAVSR